MHRLIPLESIIFCKGKKETAAGSGRNRLQFLHAGKQMVCKSDRTGNLIGAQAPCTDVDMARSSIDDRLHALDVGFPGSIGTSVGMGDLNAECNALAADFALSHSLHLLAISNKKLVS